MIFKAFRQDKKEEEKEVFFDLLERNGAVGLIVVDSNGNQRDGGHVLWITKEGRLSLCTFVKDQFGLDLGKSGQITLE